MPKLKTAITQLTELNTYLTQQITAITAALSVSAFPEALRILTETNTYTMEEETKALTLAAQSKRILDTTTPTSSKRSPRSTIELHKELTIQKQALLKKKQILDEFSTRIAAAETERQQELTEKLAAQASTFTAPPPISIATDAELHDLKPEEGTVTLPGVAEVPADTLADEASTVETPTKIPVTIDTTVHDPIPEERSTTPQAIAEISVGAPADETLPIEIHITTEAPLHAPIPEERSITPQAIAKATIGTPLDPVDMANKPAQEKESALICIIDPEEAYEAAVARLRGLTKQSLTTANQKIHAIIALVADLKDNKEPLPILTMALNACFDRATGSLPDDDFKHITQKIQSEPSRGLKMLASIMLAFAVTIAVLGIVFIPQLIGAAAITATTLAVTGATAGFGVASFGLFKQSSRNRLEPLQNKLSLFQETLDTDQIRYTQPAVSEPII